MRGKAKRGGRRRRARGRESESSEMRAIEEDTRAFEGKDFKGVGKSLWRRGTGGRRGNLLGKVGARQRR